MSSNRPRVTRAVLNEAIKSAEKSKFEAMKRHHDFGLFGRPRKRPRHWRGIVDSDFDKYGRHVAVWRCEICGDTEVEVTYD